MSKIREGVFLTNSITNNKYTFSMLGNAIITRYQKSIVNLVPNFFKILDFQRSEFRISIYVSIGGKVEILQLLFDLGRSGNL